MIMKLIEFIKNKIKLAFGLMTGKAKIANKSDTTVVCIGMQHSAKYGSCPGSTLDSNAMAALLSKYGDVTLLQDRNATIEAVRLALINALNSKLCIFYYSGHGGQKQDRNGQNGISEYLCLNNGPLHDYEIWDLISKSKGRVVMIFDCCHSATMYRDHVFGGVEKFKNTGFAFKMLQVPLTLDTKNILVQVALRTTILMEAMRVEYLQMVFVANLNPQIPMMRSGSGLRTLLKANILFVQY